MARTSTRLRVVYGLDLEQGRGRVVRLMAGRGGLQVSTVYDSTQPASVPLPTLAEKISAEVRAGRALCAGCLPVRDTLVRNLSVPFASLSKARKVLPSSLDVELPFPLEDCVYDFPLLERTADRRVRALAAAARNEALDQRLADYAGAGFDPTHLDHEGLALWDEAAACRAKISGRVLLLHLADTRCIAAIGDADGLPAFHAMRIGLEDLAGQADARDRLGGRLQRLLQAYEADGDRAGPVGLIWSGVPHREVRAALEAALAGQTADSISELDEPAGALARALARRALGPSTLPCSLRTGKREHEALVGRRRNADQRAAIQASVAGALLVLLGAAWLHLLDRREQALEQQLTETARGIIGDNIPVQRGQERLQAERAATERRLLERPLYNLLSAGVSTRLADLLRIADERGFRLESLQVQRDYSSVAGSSPDWDLCEVLSSYLQGQGFETRLKRQDAGADERVHFSIQGGLDHAP